MEKPDSPPDLAAMGFSPTAKFFIVEGSRVYALDNGEVWEVFSTGVPQPQIQACRIAGPLMCVKSHRIA
jgi:hypothetical protein